MSESSAAAGIVDEFRELLIVERLDEASGVVSLRLADPNGAPLPAWEPGAHVDVLLEGGLERQYSLCSRVGEPTWRIAVLREPAGRGGSAAIHDGARQGELLKVRGPRNHFVLVKAPDYLFIAGGIGVTPLMPMLAAAQASGATWRFSYGGRSRDSMAFVDRLAEFGVVPWPQDEMGLLPLAELIAGCSPETAVYCCGPEPLISAVEQACAAAGRPAPHVERFAPKAIDTTGDHGDHEFTVVINSSGNEYLVPADRSIAEVLQAAGEKLVTSCAEGICGTCETKVISGAIVHRDSLLSQEDRDEGIFMMPCVSRCAGDRLVLDL
jgi:ferredoxin-NADP reductase